MAISNGDSHFSSHHTLLMLQKGYQKPSGYMLYPLIGRHFKVIQALMTNLHFNQTIAQSYRHKTALDNPSLSSHQYFPIMSYRYFSDGQAWDMMSYFLSLSAKTYQLPQATYWQRHRSAYARYHEARAIRHLPLGHRAGSCACIAVQRIA